MAECVELFITRERARTVLLESPKLIDWLRKNNLKVNPVSWSGQSSDFPTHRAGLFYCSDFIDMSIRVLKERCANTGHVLFLDDRLIDEQGRHADPNDLIVKVAELFGMR